MEGSMRKEAGTIWEWGSPKAAQHIFIVPLTLTDNDILYNCIWNFCNIMTWPG